MPKHISEKELKTITSLLAGRPDGWRISEIETQLADQGLGLNRRTLQRRLVQLEKTGRIQITGVGRGTVFVPVSSRIGRSTGNRGLERML